MPNDPKPHAVTPRVSAETRIEREQGLEQRVADSREPILSPAVENAPVSCPTCGIATPSQHPDGGRCSDPFHLCKLKATPEIPWRTFNDGKDPWAEGDFAKELERLINRHSQENGSDTPDFILAGFLGACLAAWNEATQRRETWYGRQGTGAREAPPFMASAPDWREAALSWAEESDALQHQLTVAEWKLTVRDNANRWSEEFYERQVDAQRSRGITVSDRPKAPARESRRTRWEQGETDLAPAACPKCGGHQISGPVYDRSLDVLKFTCICGYRTTLPPLDRRPCSDLMPAPVSTDDLLRQGRSMQGGDTSRMTDA